MHKTASAVSQSYAFSRVTTTLLPLHTGKQPQYHEVSACLSAIIQIMPMSSSKIYPSMIHDLDPWILIPVKEIQEVTFKRRLNASVAELSRKIIPQHYYQSHCLLVLPWNCCNLSPSAVFGLFHTSLCSYFTLDRLPTFALLITHSVRIAIRRSFLFIENCALRCAVMIVRT